MRSKRPFRSLIVCVSCAMVGCILASTAYSRRVDELEIERDIYASKSSNREADLRLKKWAQKKAMEYYGWPEARFIQEFGRSYL